MSACSKDIKKGSMEKSEAKKVLFSVKPEFL
jgi:hypothetical protein